MHIKILLVALGAAVIRVALQRWQFFANLNGTDLNELVMHILPIFIYALIWCCMIVRNHGRSYLDRPVLALFFGALCGELAAISHYLFVVRQNILYPIDVHFALMYMAAGLLTSSLAILIAGALANALPLQRRSI